MGLLEWLFGKSGSGRAAPEWMPELPAPEPTGKLEGGGAYDFDIVGESRYQENLLAIAGPKTEEGCEIECEATLWREPLNAYDPYAIRVDISGRTVGYFSRADAAAVAPVMDGRGIPAVRADALIVGGWKRSRDEGSFGVRLDLPFDQQE
ncbi:hypothetical protein [Nostoc phage Nsp-JY10]